MLERIATDVNDAGLFSVQMDSTADESIHDQHAVVVIKVCRRGQRERKAIASCKCVLLKNPKSPQFTREVLEEVGV